MNKDKLQEWFKKNKVFLSGLGIAIGYSFVQYTQSGNVDTKDMVLSLAIAAFSYATKNLAGSGSTIAGMLLAGLIAYGGQTSPDEKIQWVSIIAAMVAAFIGAKTPESADRTLYHTPIFQAAKKQAEEMKNVRKAGGDFAKEDEAASQIPVDLTTKS